MLISFLVNRRTPPTTQPASGCQQHDSINARCRQPRQSSRGCAPGLLVHATVDCDAASSRQYHRPTCCQACVGRMVERIDALARNQQFLRRPFDLAARRGVGNEHAIGMKRTEPVAHLRRRRTLPPHTDRKRRDQTTGAVPVSSTVNASCSTLD